MRMDLIYRSGLAASEAESSCVRLFSGFADWDAAISMPVMGVSLIFKMKPREPILIANNGDTAEY